MRIRGQRVLSLDEPVECPYELCSWVAVDSLGVPSPQACRGDLLLDPQSIDPEWLDCDEEGIEYLAEAVLDRLSDRRAGVVRMTFGLTDGQPKSLEEIAKVYGVTCARMRGIQREALELFRQGLWSALGRDGNPPEPQQKAASHGLPAGPSHAGSQQGRERLRAGSHIHCKDVHLK